MNRNKKLTLWACIIISLITIVLPSCAFAEEDLKLVATELILEKGDVYKIEAPTHPFDELIFASSDSAVAWVDDEGRIHALAKGEAIIAAWEKNGGTLAYCNVIVDPDEEQILYPQVHFYQGDRKWGFSAEVRKKACVLTSMAMLLKNSGIDTNPADTYRKNGNNSGMNFRRVLNYYEMRTSCALAYDSPYLKSYDFAGGKTRINNPAKNYEAAVTEALERHPEGVICYFVKGDDAHAIVATGIEDGKIYYNDAGRKATRGEHVTFKNTWCSHNHKMDYGDFAYFIAIN